MSTTQTSPFAAPIAQGLGVDVARVAAAIALLEEGNTLPFIARYRKERTGALDEEQLRAVASQLESLRALEERRAAILASIGEQGKLTPELELQLREARTRTALEDLYQPYRPKRRTRAGIAREKGLQGLADLIVAQPLGRQSAEQLAEPFLGEQVATAEEALAGARDIVAEALSDHPGVRGMTRAKALQWGTLRCDKVEGAADERGVYRLYYEFATSVGRVKPYQVLAINRGEREGVLRVGVLVPERDWQAAVSGAFRPDRRSPLAEQLSLAIADSAERLLLPAIERDVRRELTEKAEQHAIGVFAQNLRGLLSQPPLAGQTVLGIDPGFRTGCKVAVVDPTGRLLATTTIYPHTGKRGWDEALGVLVELVGRHSVTLITIGNGTASRETEELVATLVRERGGHYMMVSEAGASVYSASPLARAELPELDVSLRGAVSIARRAQDPLAELVKIDPQAIGVGLYQHDVDQGRLASALAGVVEGVVNAVGVDVNTASPAHVCSGDRPQAGREDRRPPRRQRRLCQPRRAQEGLGAGAEGLRAGGGLSARARGRRAARRERHPPRELRGGTRAACSRRCEPCHAAGRAPGSDRQAAGRDCGPGAGGRAGGRVADLARHPRAVGAPRPRPARRPAAANSAPRRAEDGGSAAGAAAQRHCAQRRRLRGLRRHRRQAGWPATPQPAAAGHRAGRRRRDRGRGAACRGRARAHRPGVAEGRDGGLIRAAATFGLSAKYHAV
jgi:hypothetical protein